MHILIVPDKLKGCLTAMQAADAIAAGVRLAMPEAEIDLCSIADGGEGTAAAILRACGGRLITRRVTGPLPEMKVDASLALLDDNNTAVIEMSAASRLALLAIEDRNPLHTTTFGTGELIVAAIREGAKKILLGLGGSATIDAGIGMLQACGFTILTRDGVPTNAGEPLCGCDLRNVLMIKHGRGEVTNGIELIGLADVTNPLLGALGAARIFGPQKGATPDGILQLESDLNSLTSRTGSETFADEPGSGAAGGLGFGIRAFMRGKVVNGFDFIATALDLRSRIQKANLCITAEGRLDSQSANGKAVGGVARLCNESDVSCIALAGSIGPGAESLHAHGLTSFFSLCDAPMTLEESMQDATRLLTESALNCTRLWMANSLRSFANSSVT